MRLWLKGSRRRQAAHTLFLQDASAPFNFQVVLRLSGRDSSLSGAARVGCIEPSICPSPGRATIAVVQNTRLRSVVGCSTSPGAAVQNMGNPGSQMLTAPSVAARLRRSEQTMHRRTHNPQSCTKTGWHRGISTHNQGTNPEKRREGCDINLPLRDGYRCAQIHAIAYKDKKPASYSSCACGIHSSCNIYSPPSNMRKLKISAPTNRTPYDFLDPSRASANHLFVSLVNAVKNRPRSMQSRIDSRPTTSYPRSILQRPYPFF